jgi:hypothetical protein
VSKTTWVEAQAHELNFWSGDTDPEGYWWHYDMVFLPYLYPTFKSVIDIGSGPVPYIMSHNVRYVEGWAFDTLTAKYRELHQFDKYLIKPFTACETIPQRQFEAVFCLNMLDHVGVPQDVIRRVVEACGDWLFFYCDVNKTPDNMHPHTISVDWVLSELSGFNIQVCQIKKNRVFDNNVMFYVGRRRK